MIEPIQATRVQIICPCGDELLYRATNRIIVELLRVEQKIQQWGGLTYSSLETPVFSGLFWRDDKTRVERGYWEPDRNAIIIMDAPNTPLTEALEYFATLKPRVHRIYEEEGKPQHALWIVGHDVSVVP